MAATTMLSATDANAQATLRLNYPASINTSGQALLPRGGTADATIAVSNARASGGNTEVRLQFPGQPTTGATLRDGERTIRLNTGVTVTLRDDAGDELPGSSIDGGATFDFVDGSTLVMRWAIRQSYFTGNPGRGFTLRVGAPGNATVGSTLRMTLTSSSAAGVNTVVNPTAGSTVGGVADRFVVFVPPTIVAAVVSGGRTLNESDPYVNNGDPGDASIVEIRASGIPSVSGSTNTVAVRINYEITGGATGPGGTNNFRTTPTAGANVSAGGDRRVIWSAISGGNTGTRTGTITLSKALIDGGSSVVAGDDLLPGSSQLRVLNGVAAGSATVRIRFEPVERNRRTNTSFNFVITSATVAPGSANDSISRITSLDNGGLFTIAGSAVPGDSRLNRFSMNSGTAVLVRFDSSASFIPLDHDSNTVTGTLSRHVAFTESLFTNITPVLPAATVRTVEGTNANGGSLIRSGRNPGNPYTTAFLRALDLTGLTPGRNTVLVTVRPENALANGSDDRTYTFTIINPSATPAPLPIAMSPATQNVIAEGGAGTIFLGPLNVTVPENAINMTARLNISSAVTERPSTNRVIVGDFTLTTSGGPGISAIALNATQVLVSFDITGGLPASIPVNIAAGAGSGGDVLTFTADSYLFGASGGNRVGNITTLTGSDRVTATVTAVAADASTDLSNLSVGGGSVPGFVASTTDYDVGLPGTQTTAAITAMAQDTGATIELRIHDDSIDPGGDLAITGPAVCTDGSDDDDTTDCGVSGINPGDLAIIEVVVSPEGSGLPDIYTVNITGLPKPTAELATAGPIGILADVAGRTREFTITLKNIPESVTVSNTLYEIENAYLAMELTGAYTTPLRNKAGGGVETNEWFLEAQDPADESNRGGDGVFQNRFLFNTDPDDDLVHPDVTYTFMLTTEDAADTADDLTIEIINAALADSGDTERHQIDSDRRSGTPLTIAFVDSDSGLVFAQNRILDPIAQDIEVDGTGNVTMTLPEFLTDEIAHPDRAESTRMEILLNLADGDAATRLGADQDTRLRTASLGLFNLSSSDVWFAGKDDAVLIRAIIDLDGGNIPESVTFSVSPQTGADAEARNNLVLRAVAAQFTGDDSVLDGDVVVFGDDGFEVTGQTIRINAIAAAITDVALTGVTVHGETVTDLSEVGSGSGHGVVSITAGPDTQVDVVLDLLDDDDSTQVTGVKANPDESLTGVEGTARAGDRTVTLSDFSPGTNLIQIVVTDDDGTPDPARTYDIRVRVEALPVPTLRLLNADGTLAMQTPRTNTVIDGAPTSFTLQVRDYLFDIDGNDGSNDGFLRINLRVTGVEDFHANTGDFAPVGSPTGRTDADSGNFTFGFGSTTDSTITFTRGGSVNILGVRVPKALLATDGNEDIALTIAAKAGITDQTMTDLIPVDADAFGSLSANGAATDGIGGADGISEARSTGRLGITAIIEARSSAAITGTTAIGDTRTASTEVTINLNPGAGAKLSAGTATATLTFTGGTRGTHYSVTAACATGNTGGCGSASLSGDTLTVTGGTDTPTTASGDVTLTVVPMDITDTTQTVVIGMSNLVYAPTDNSNENGVSEFVQITEAAATAVTVTIADVAGATLETTDGLTVASAVVGREFSALTVDGYLGADAAAVDVFLPGTVESGDAISFVANPLANGDTVHVCPGTGLASPSNSVTDGTRTAALTGFDGTAKVVTVYVIPAALTATAPADCTAAVDPAADPPVEANIYTYNVQVAPATGTTTLGSASPPDVPDNGGMATIPLVLSGFPEQVRVGTSLVNLEAVNVSFSTANIGPTPSSVDSNNLVITYPGFYTITPSADTGAVTATVMPNFFFSLLVPVTNGGATVSLNIDALNVADGLLPAEITFLPRPDGYSYMPESGAPGDSPLDSSLTNRDPGNVAFTIVAASVPHAMVTINGSTSIPETSAGRVFNISLSNLETGTPAAVVIPFRIDGSAANSATWGDDTSTNDYTISAGGGDGADTMVGTFATNSGVTTGRITIPTTDQNADGTGSGSFTVVVRDDSTDTPEEVDPNETIVLEITKAADVRPTDLTIGSPTVFNLRTVEEASVGITPTLALTEGGSGTLTVEVDRGDLGTDLPIVVNYAVATGATAESGDYTLAPAGRLTFAAEADLTMNNTIAVTANQDTDRDDEAFSVQITSVVFGGNAATAPHLATGGGELVGAVSAVSIADNDADAVLSVTDAVATEAGRTTAAFQVVISDAPAELTTINLTIGGTALYGEAPDYDYTIAASGPTPTLITTNLSLGANGGTLVATTMPDASGDATVTFTVTASDDMEPRETDSISVAFAAAGVTNMVQNTDFAESGSGTISIEDNDIADPGFCQRTAEVQTLIIARITGMPACGDVLISQLNSITTLDLSTVATAATLMRNDLQHLSGLTSLTLWSDLAVIEDRALDPVLSTLTTEGIATGLTGLPATLKGSVFIATGGSTEIALEQSATITVNRTNPYIAISVPYMATYASTVDADFEGETGTLIFGTDVTSQPITVRDLGTANLAGSVTIMLGTPVLGTPDLAVDTRSDSDAESITLAAAIVETDSAAAANSRLINVTLPTVTASLSTSAIEIGEKAEGEGEIVLNLSGVLTEHELITVTFNLEAFDDDADSTVGIPSLATGGAGTETSPYLPDTATSATDDRNIADYTLVVTDSAGNNPAFMLPLGGAATLSDIAAGRDVTFDIPAGGQFATFTFTAIDDERKEGSEIATLTVDQISFNHGDAVTIQEDEEATIEVKEVGAEDVMRETEAIAMITGKQQVSLVTQLIRGRIAGRPAGVAPRVGTTVSLAENPETMQDFFSQLALEHADDMDSGGNYAVWARGQYSKISGTPDLVGRPDFEYDGTISGVGVGIERREGSTLVGLSLNFSSADVKMESGIRDKSTHKETITFFAPYAAYKPVNTALTVWGTAGAGFGTAKINSTSHDEGSPSVQVIFANAGVDYATPFARNSEIVFGLSALSISKSVDAFTLNVGPLPGISSDVFQARGDMTLFMPVDFGGSVIRPYVGVSSVHDMGDVIADDKHAMEGKVGVSWLTGLWSVDVNAFTQFLREDEKAWGVFGEVGYAGVGSLDGLIMGLSGEHGTASSMSDAVAATDTASDEIDTDLSSADSDVPEWSLGMDAEYGFSAPLLHRDGRVSPFLRGTHSGDAQTLGSGVRLDINNNIGMTLESNRYLPANDDPYSEHAVGLEARWEF